MNIKAILEEYLDLKIKTKVFKNPSKEEINKASGMGEARFIATSNPKAVYFFNPERSHLFMAKILKIGEGYYNLNNPSIFGVATKSGERWLMDWSNGLDEIVFSDPSEYKFVKKIIKIKWDWLSSYMINFPKWWKDKKEDIKDEIKKQKHQYSEEYKNSFKANQKYDIDVYENPTKDELEKVKKYDTIRFFIVPKGKKIIAFTPLINHKEASRKLGFSSNRFDVNDFRLHLLATIKRHSGIINPINTQVNEIVFKKPTDKKKAEFIKKVANTNWKFVNKYIPGFTDWWNKRIQPALKRNVARWGNEF